MDKLYVSSSPHIRDTKTPTSIMGNVIIALIPAIIGSVIFFSFRAALVVGVSVISCVLFEFLYSLFITKKSTISDLSAVVTGIFLGFNLPVTVPLWLPVIGAAFSILIVKMLFGGIGKNIVNPAIGGRLMLTLSFSSLVNKFVAPIGALHREAATLPLFKTPIDVVSSATPLSYIKSGDITLTNNISILDLFLGSVGGCLGETSSILLLLGGFFLLYKRIISWRIPCAYLGTVAVISFLFPNIDGMPRFEFMLYSLLSGSLILGAFFMATDYSTSPITPHGKLIFGVGCGLVTVFIRYFSSYPEGVSFAILFMNFFVWFIDKHTIPRKFGGEKNGSIFKKTKHSNH